MPRMQVPGSVVLPHLPSHSAAQWRPVPGNPDRYIAELPDLAILQSSGGYNED